MPSRSLNEEAEQILSRQTDAQWDRRELELNAWVTRSKQKRKDKLTRMLEAFEVDAELFPALFLLRQLRIPTEFSCAGVSLLDDPFEHSLYAYITIQASDRTEAFVRFASAFMKQRLLVTYEPAFSRYDLSSFFIGHNRSFCLLMQRCAEAYERITLLNFDESAAVD